MINLRIEQPTPSRMILRYCPVTVRTTVTASITLSAVFLFMGLLLLFCTTLVQIENSSYSALLVFLAVVVVPLLAFIYSATIHGRSKTFILDKDQGYVICTRHGLFGTKLGEKTSQISLAEISAIKVQAVRGFGFFFPHNNLYFVHTSNHHTLISYFADEESYNQANRIREFLNLEIPNIATHVSDSSDIGVVAHLTNYFARKKK